jgi:hypothetical protein
LAKIVRGPRAADHFTIISNSALRDERLSWKARGLLAYLLSMETGWETSVRRLATVAPDGKSAVETALAELEAAGYLERRQVRGEDAGRFGGTEYHVCDDATVTRFSGHGFSGTGSSVPGESATKNNSPKKTSTTEDRSAALRAATATPVETSSSSITSDNASARENAAAAAAATTSKDARGDATRATPDDILETMMLNPDEGARFRAWLVEATGATNPDGLIVTLHTGGRLSERIAQWRTAETFSRPVPGPGRSVARPAWCGECDRSTRLAVATDREGHEYVRRCPVCNPNTGTTPAGAGAAQAIAVTAASVDRTPGMGREAFLAARATLPAGTPRRTTTIGTVQGVATVRATQDGAL